MRFFNGKDIVTYPDSANELKAKILEDSLRGPQRSARAYFELYFKNEGKPLHPVLGDLKELVSEIESQWNYDRCGLNLIAASLRNSLGMKPYCSENSSDYGATEDVEEKTNRMA
jgi:hypothetical protein